MTTKQLKCSYEEPWLGGCTKEVISGKAYCGYHIGIKCWCGAKATHGCSIAVSLMCGNSLCDDHECNFRGHSETGTQQYKTWKKENSDETQ
jgi:hypothetical protein